MKNSLKVALVAGLLVVGFGFGLSFCGSKPEKPEETIDTLKTEQDTVQVQSDTTTQAADTTQAN